MRCAAILGVPVKNEGGVSDERLRDEASLGEGNEPRSRPRRYESPSLSHPARRPEGALRATPLGIGIPRRRVGLKGARRKAIDLQKRVLSSRFRLIVGRRGKGNE